MRVTASLAVALGLLAVALPAEARQRRAAPVECFILCPEPPVTRREARRRARGLRLERALPIGRTIPPAHARTGGLVAPLAEKVASIVAACGSRVLSGYRHTVVRGTRRLSLHASGQAADLAGNPSCIYGQLGGWAGGYSTDYGRVKHVHISWGGREAGLRFVHGGRRHVRRR